MNDPDILMDLQTSISRVQQRLARIERVLGSALSAKEPGEPTPPVLSPGAFLLEAMRATRNRKWSEA